MSAAASSSSEVEAGHQNVEPLLRRRSSRALWSASHPHTRDPLPARFRRPRLFQRFRWRRGNRTTDASENENEQRVFLNAPDENARFSKNLFITSKYTLLTFLPKNLGEQARRVANSYFILITALQFIPGVSPIPLYITLVPLILILGIVAVKEGYEDLLRHRSDARVNSAPVLRLDAAGGSHEVKSREVGVGDIIAVSRDAVCAADIVVLATEHATHATPVCWVDTANLDGETRLKVRRAVPLRDFFPELASRQDNDDENAQPSNAQLVALQAVLTSDAPNPFLEVFSGRLDAVGSSSEDGDDDDDAAAVQVVRENMILRGAVLRNTARVWGVVVGAGPTTKLRMNQQLPKFKFSRLERQMNVSLGIVFAGLVLVCAAMAAVLVATQARFRDDFNWGFPGEGDAAAAQDFFLAFTTWFILLSFAIPMSLYVILEMGKLLGGLYIWWDPTMFSRDGLRRPAKPNTTSLVDELGGVEYILSDKTGTLTDNEMAFSHCGTASALYALQDGRLVAEKQSAAVALSGRHSSAPSRRSDGSDSGAQDPALRELLRVMAVCNELEVEASDDASGDAAFMYSGESPDEVALADAAAALGVELQARSPSRLRVRGEELEVLAVLPFTSSRKRMAVAVCVAGGQTATVYYKGADSAMFEMLRDAGEGKNARAVAALEEHVDELSRKGLRTLVMASRRDLDMRGSEWSAFAEAYAEAQLQLQDRDAAVGAAWAALESNLTPVGCTGVEDKLSEGVEDALQSFVAAGVQVAVLTGDKTETAISICRSCGLFVEGSHILLVTDPDPVAISAALADGLARSRAGSAGSDVESGRPALEALVLSGDCLRVIMDDAEAATAMKKQKNDLRSQLVSTMSRCYTTVCTRVTPSQKAAVAQLVRREFNKVTLAIGDGANDVSMLREAEVGVGVYGKEGSQAVNASDFALHKFADLKTLILVHGATCRLRIVSAARASIFANLALSLPQLAYGFFSAYSGTNVELANALTVVNVLMTAPLLLCLAMIDRELLPEELARSPHLYNPRAFMFTLREFAVEAALALWHGAIGIAVGVAFGTVWRGDGVVGGRPAVMTIITMVTIGGSLLSLGLRFRCVTWLHTLSVVFAALMLVAASLLVPEVYDPINTDNGYILAYVGAAPGFWALLVVGLVASALPDFVKKAVQNLYFPTPMQRHRELIRERDRLASI